MSDTVHGIHHVTVIAGDPVENLNFYKKTLGMRLVKKSVNQDAPETYHLFFADAAGSPGSDLTFFPWPDMRPGFNGIGLTTEVPLAVDPDAIDYWLPRLQKNGVSVGDIELRFGEKTLPFVDTHGLRLALVETTDERDFAAWQESPVPVEHQIKGIHTVRLWERELAATEKLLYVLGFTKLADEKGWTRYGVDGGGSGKIVEVREIPDGRRGMWGPGIVHHVAWRVNDSDEELAVRKKIAAAGLSPTEQIDRFWFKSIYFKEPGGALFEIATDGPGFSVDEEPDKLGEKLILPPWLESAREQIEAALPDLGE
ncbi:MAG: ring-cleaving dioxygenase [Calditrichia bacterium]